MFLLLLLVASLTSTAGAVLWSSSSSHQTVQTGSTVVFVCRTNTSSSIRWLFYPPSSSRSVVIHSGLSFNPLVWPRYKVHVNHQSSELIVVGVHRNDSGTFVCHETNTVTGKQEFQLSVTDTEQTTLQETVPGTLHHVTNPSAEDGKTNNNGVAYNYITLGLIAVLTFSVLIIVVLVLVMMRRKRAAADAGQINSGLKSTEHPAPPMRDVLTAIPPELASRTNYINPAGLGFSGEFQGIPMMTYTGNHAYEEIEVQGQSYDSLGVRDRGVSLEQAPVEYDQLGVAQRRGTQRRQHKDSSLLTSTSAAAASKQQMISDGGPIDSRLWD